MLILVSGASRVVNEYQSRSAYIGRLIVPGSWNSLDALHIRPQRAALDNGAFKQFDEKRFVRLLERCRPHAGDFLFVAAPDKVGDADATLQLFNLWEPVIHSLGFRVALVSQDGLRHKDTPWDRFDAMFIGGSTEWKLGNSARSLAGYAKALGKWLHMGRVNTRTRMDYAYSIGCDSIDGTGVSKWPDVWLPVYLEWLYSIMSKYAIQK